MILQPHTAAIKRWFQRLTRRRGKLEPELLLPRLALAAFGKHPGWDDHIPGLGIETQSLAEVQQRLYVEGIGGQVEAGAWEKLEPAKRTPGYDHTFLWFRSAHLLLGRLWSSTDGKGRAKYPMVLCLDSEGVSPAALLERLLPEVEHLREACQAAKTAEQVTRSWCTGQEQLRAGLKQDGGKIGGDDLSFCDKQKFLERSDFGPERVGLLRVLHDLSALPLLSANGGKAPPGTVASFHPHGLRVPLAADSFSRALLLWAEFLRGLLPKTTPLLLLARTGSPWLDIIMGEPASDDFFCLQASLQALPLVTQIPYQLAPDLKQRLQAVETNYLGPPPPASSAVPVAPAAVPSSPSAQTAPPSGSKLPLLLCVLG